MRLQGSTHKTAEGNQSFAGTSAVEVISSALWWQVREQSR